MPYSEINTAKHFIWQSKSSAVRKGFKDNKKKVYYIITIIKGIFDQQIRAFRLRFTLIDIFPLQHSEESTCALSGYTWKPGHS